MATNPKRIPLTTMASAQFIAFTTYHKQTSTNSNNKSKTAANDFNATPKGRQAQNRRHQVAQISSMSINSSSTSEGLIPPMVKCKLKTMTHERSLSSKNPQNQKLPSSKIKDHSKVTTNPTINPTSNPGLDPNSLNHGMKENDSQSSDEDQLLYSKSPSGHALEMDNTTFWNGSSMNDESVTEISAMEPRAVVKPSSSSEESNSADFDFVHNRDRISLGQEEVKEKREERMKSPVSKSDSNHELPVKALQFSGDNKLANGETKSTPLDEDLEKKKLENWLTYGAVMKLNSEQERLQYAADVFDSLYDGHFQNITCDVKVKVGDQVFQTNRFLLNYHSKKLGDVLAMGDLVKTSQVSLVEVPQRIFQTIYNWMYGRNVDLSDNEISQIFYFAQELGFQDLVDEIKQLQTEMLSPNCAPEMYAFAKVHAINALEALAMHLMTHHFEKVTTKDSFLKLPATAFIYLLKQDDVSVRTENAIVKAALQWLSYEDDHEEESPSGRVTHSRHQYADSIFFLIRLESMPLQEFLKLPKIVQEWQQSHNYPPEQTSRLLSISHIAKRWNKRLFMAQRYQLAKLSGWHATSTMNLVPVGYLIRPRHHLSKGLSRQAMSKTSAAPSARPSVLNQQPYQNSSRDARLRPSVRTTNLASQGKQDFWYEIMPDVPVANNPTHRTLQSLIENLPITIQLHHLEHWLSHAIQQQWNLSNNRRKRCLKVIHHLGKKETLRRTADVILVAEDVEFKMHRCLLLHHFPDLGEKLYGSKVGFQPRVTLYGVRVHMVDFFYKWMYAADLSLDEEAGLTFSKVGYYAKQFGFKPLLKLWSRLASDLLDPFFGLEVIKNRQTEDEKHDPLKKFAYTMIMKRFSRIVHDPRYVDLPYPMVCWLLSRDDVYIKSELEVFEAASKWLYYNWISRQHIAHHVMNCVRFSLLDAKELLQLVTVKDSKLTILNSEHMVSQWDRLNMAMQMTMSQLTYAASGNLKAYDNPRTNIGKMSIEDFQSFDSTQDHRDILQVEDTAEDPPTHEVIVLGCRAANKQATTTVDSTEQLIMWRLNRTTQRWDVESTTMPGIFKDMAAIVLGRSIYVTGGNAGVVQGGSMVLTPLTRVLRYDYEKKQWTSTTPMNAERAYHSGVALNGYLYVIGGMDGEGHFLSEVERYDPASSKWSFMQSLHRPRAATAAATHRGRVWVVGGLEKHGYYKIVSNLVECYEPKQDSWQVMQVLDVPRLFAVLIEHNDRLYLIGGATNDAHYQKGRDLQVVRSIIVYSDEKNEWVYETTLRSSRLRFAAGIYSDNTDDYLLVVGGRDQNSQAYLSTVECYCLKSKRWNPEAWIPNIPFALQSHCCLRVPFTKTS